MQYKLHIATLVTCVSLPVSAIAEEANDTGLLEPIMVTAEKRTEDSIDVPVSLSVADGVSLEDRKTRLREDVIAETPNVLTGAVTARLYTSYTAIRGVGSALIESDPAVGIYIDGVGLGTSQAHSGSLLDVDRVEILRGPQGTLYGRNNIAGSVNIISNKPNANNIEYDASVEYGSHDSYRGSLMFNAPLTEDNWALRGALSGGDKGTKTSSTITGKELGGKKDIHGRLSLSGDMTENLEFLGIVDIERQILGAEMFGMPEADFTNGLNGVAIDDPNRIESNLAILSGQLTYHFDNDDQIISQTGYQSNQVKVSGNGFPKGYFSAINTAYNGLFPGINYRSDNPYDGDYWQISQEVRYVSKSNEDFNWVAGLYGEYASASRKYGANSQHNSGAIELGSVGDTKTTSFSAFWDGEYGLTDRWDIFGGLRVGHDRKKFDYDFIHNADAVTAGLTRSFASAYSDDFSHTYATPRIGVKVAVSEDSNIYATVSSGYKSGGFNAGFVGIGDEGSYDAERLINYEVGFKSADIFDGLSVDGSVFYIDWRDQQVQAFDPVTSTTPLMNAPRSQSVGAELAARYHFNRNWSIRAAGGYTDATYQDFTNARATKGTSSIDASGNQQQYVSRYTGNAGINYQAPIGWDDLVAKAGVSYQYRSGYYFDVENTIRQSGYGLINANAALENDDYAIELYARNLGDKRYRTVSGNVGYGNLVSVGDPLYVGLVFRIKGSL